MFYYKFKALRGRLLQYLIEITTPIYRKIRRKTASKFMIPIARMREMPEKSFGHMLALFMDKEQLTFIEGFECHDYYHVLLEYGTSPEDEARMQFFLLGNGKYTPFVFGTVLLSFTLIPEYWGVFWKDFKRGIMSTTVYTWDFEDLLFEDIYTLRQMIKVS